MAIVIPHDIRGNRVKFKIKVSNIDVGEPWHEPYDKPEVTNLKEAQAWAKDTVKWFNETCQSGEQHRELHGVELDGPSEVHEWYKLSLTTQLGSGRLSGQSYDVMACENCDVTGKRFGLGEGGIKRDSKFRAKKYSRCQPNKVEVTG
ncbi:MAG TPA: hypothetical protein ENI05_08895 [Porticoccus sp.]|nr:hypothetical protein [Porticoccus sp.]